MFKKVKIFFHAITIKPRMYLALFLLRFLPPYLSVVKGKNNLGEIKWYIFLYKEGNPVYVEWNKYADIVREEYLKLNN